MDQIQNLHSVNRRIVGKTCGGYPECNFWGVFPSGGGQQSGQKARQEIFQALG